jgi:pullulanase
MLTPMSYDQYPVYEGQDLGMTWSARSTTFKLWSPAAESARLMLYAAGQGGTAKETIELTRDKNGTWSHTIRGDQHGTYYTVQVKSGGRWLAETPDPYAKAVGINGLRGMIVDLARTNPDGWKQDVRPPLAQLTDIILYELHVRDLSSHPNSGIKNRGKFLGLAEKDTQNKEGMSTGLDHIKSLGVTHVHLLPSFDYRSIDESQVPPKQYNWGYDPEHYNVPEGSYATDAADGAVRIREFKQAIQALHQSGLRVVMDVVYNHTGSTTESVFNRCVPGYYYRQRPDGSFSDASACGNETASDRAMMRRYIVQSVVYWATEYHVDGFRFDLMGIHDIETMNEVRAALKKVDPTIYVYGEGWTAGDSPLPVEQRALKAHTHRMTDVAAFSDDFRDALKGSVFDHDDTGFVSGKPGQEESIKFGIVAATRHPQVAYDKVNYSKAPWANEPHQSIQYAECHDNHTLWDRLKNSRPDASEADRIKMHKLTLAMILTAQGVPFLHAGTEFLRTKKGEENSYKSPDDINWMDWDRRSEHDRMVDYTQRLIQLRKNHPAFRLQSADLIRKHLRFWEGTPANVVAFEINDAPNERWRRIIVIHNGSGISQTLTIPDDSWKIVLSGGVVNENGLAYRQGGQLEVAPYDSVILRE